MLEVKNLSKRYYKFGGIKINALENVSFCLKKGETAGLIGPNGAGKTTLIKILGLLLMPDEGNIFLNGVDVMKNREALLKKAGILLGDHAHYLYSNLNILENLKLFIRLKGFSGISVKKELERLIELFNLNKFVYFKVRELSTGFKKRLALAITLIGQPDFLFLDEPLSGVDVENAFYLRNLIISFSKNSLVLWASHNLSEVEKVCQKIFFLKEGRLVFKGKLKELNFSNLNKNGEYLNALEEFFISMVG